MSLRAGILAALLVLGLAACGGSGSKSTSSSTTTTGGSGGSFKAAFNTDTAGLNDKSFNHLGTSAA